MSGLSAPRGSQLSRNLILGEVLGQTQSKEINQIRVAKTVKGLATSRLALELAQRKAEGFN